jgi:hypothetical protein
MNIHFQQVERKSQSFTYLLVVFAVFTILMMTLSLSRHIAIRLSAPSLPMPAAYTENSELPAAIRAPIAPTAGVVIVITTPQPAGNIAVTLVHQPIPAPMPSVP